VIRVREAVGIHETITIDLPHPRTRDDVAFAAFRRPARAGLGHADGEAREAEFVLNASFNAADKFQTERIRCQPILC